MKVLYIDCGMGAAGDMLTAALSEIAGEQESFADKVNALGVGGVEFTLEEVSRCGISCSHAKVLVNGEEETEARHTSGHAHDHAHHHTHPHGHGHSEADHHHDHDHDHADHHHDHNHDHAHDHGEAEHHSHEHSHAHHHSHAHSSLADILHTIGHLPVSERVKADAEGIYRILAEGEGKAHGTSEDSVHFHEAGAKDAIIDIVAICMLMEQIAPDKVIASPVCTGYGTVRCAHGILPVPAPATAGILSGIPTYAGDLESELCTPTGAAALRYFVDEFSRQPVMAVRKTGCGAGTKDFAGRANFIRVLLGEAAEGGGVPAGESPADGGDGTIVEALRELHCNVDDMTAEEIGFAMDVLLENGALDVYAVPVTMKKTRPAVKICCLCGQKESGPLRRLMFRHTTTLGVREFECRRYSLPRRFERRETPWGAVDVKVSEGAGVVREKAEFDQIAKIAKEKEISLFDVKKEL